MLLSETEKENRRKMVLLIFSLFICCFLILTGCDQTFQPRQENNKYFFSMYGYLDASADTQWIRVAPARQDFNMPPVVPDIQVTLEQLQSGQRAVMNDSLFVPENYLNYWTTMDIEHNQTYRLKAEQPDGKSSQVTVTIPEELPIPLVHESPNPPGYNVYIDDSIEHLADVQTKWYVVLDPEGIKQKRVYSFSYRNQAEPVKAFGGAYLVFVDLEEETKQIQGSNAGSEMQVLHRQIFVAAGGPEWIEGISSIDDLEYFLDGGASDVENGLGYVVGIDSKRIPYKMCLTDDKAMIIPCPEEGPYW